MSELTPDQIKALADLAEIAKVDPNLAKIVGGLASLGGVIITILVHINNIRTKRNTAANEATAKLLSEAEERVAARIDAALKRAEEMVDELKASAEFTRTQFAEEARQFKIGIAKTSESMGRHLQMIPKIQDAIAELRRQTDANTFRTAQNEAKVDDIVTMAKKARGGR